MRFSQDFLELLDPTTAKLLHRADTLTDAGTDKVPRAEAWIKVLDRSYAQQEWLAYIGAVYFGMWAMIECDGRFQKRLVQCSNDFIRFGKEHLQELLASNHNYTQWAARTYVNNFGYLYEFYAEYYQLDEAKIEELLDLYRQEFRAYPGTSTEYHYMFHRMLWALERRDKKQAAASLRRVIQLERSSGSCYVCKNKDVLGALLLTGRVDEAKRRADEIVRDEGIPESWYDSYRNCENATADVQYGRLFRHAVLLHDVALAARFARDYRNDLLPTEDGDIYWDSELLLLAHYNLADYLRERYLREEIAVTLDEIEYSTPRAKLIFFLNAWAYFDMLTRNGISKVLMPLQKPVIPPLAEDTYDTAGLAAYCLKKADDLGARFDKARPYFDYPGLRETVRALAATD